MSRIQLQRFADLAKRASEDTSDYARLDRRAFLTGAVAFAGVTGATSAAVGRDFGTDQPQRYPDPDIVVLDNRFAGKVWNTSIERLYTGTLWAEGPAWNAVGRYLLWSDIPNNETLRWLEEDNHVSRRFRSPSGNANGNTFDYEGRQIACQHETRKVIRYEHNGEITVLADKFEDEEFNAPNDVVVHPNDGSIWFTDPGYGSLGAYEGNRLPEASKSPRPLRKESVYRIDTSGKTTLVADQPFKPNGLCFSNDYKRLYVSDSGTSHYPEAKDIIWVFDMDGERLKNPRTFASMEMDGKTGGAETRRRS